jgi:hypothetical protein
MDAGFLILNALILAITLESDLGVRKIRWFRTLRPAVGALAAVLFFARGIDTTGPGLLLEASALALGLGTGYAACRFMAFRSDATGEQPRTRAGWPYALAWTAVSGLKIALTYAVTSWFPHDVGRFMAAHQLTPDSVRAAFLCLALGSPLIRTAFLWAGGARYANRHGMKLRLFTRYPALSES